MTESVKSSINLPLAPGTCALTDCMLFESQSVNSFGGPNNRLRNALHAAPYFGFFLSRVLDVIVGPSN